MAQTAAIMSFTGDNGLRQGDEPLLYYFVGVDEARFRRPVVPGDQLRMEVTAERISRSMCKYQAYAFVDGQEVARAKLMCAIRPMEK